MKHPLRWKRQPKEKGLAGICQGERGFDLSRNKIQIAWVRKLRSGGYYWYGCSKNTSATPVETIDEAKEQCYNHCKEHLAREPELSKEFGRSPKAYGATGCP